MWSVFHPWPASGVRWPIGQLRALQSRMCGPESDLSWSRLQCPSFAARDSADSRANLPVSRVLETAPRPECCPSSAVTLPWFLSHWRLPGPKPRLPEVLGTLKRLPQLPS